MNIAVELKWNADFYDDYDKLRLKLPFRNLLWNADFYDDYH